MRVIAAAVLALALGALAAGSVSAQQADPPAICSSSATIWNAVSSGRDLAAMRSVRAQTPGACRQLLARIDARIAVLTTPAPAPTVQRPPPSAPTQTTAAIQAPDARSVAATVRGPVVADASRLQDFSLFRDCADCPDLVILPATAAFTPTQDANADRDHAPTAAISRFAIARFEVRISEWNQCVREQVCPARDFEALNRAAAEGRGDPPPTGDVAAAGMSVPEAQLFLRWLSAKAHHQYRLLSSAEWEYAANANTGRKYWWGSSAERTYLNYGRDDNPFPPVAPGSHGSTARYDEMGAIGGADHWRFAAPVGSFPANPFGLFDIDGNVREFVSDCPIYRGVCDGFTARGDSWQTYEGGSGTGAISTGGSIRGVAYRQVDTGIRVARDM